MRRAAGGLHPRRRAPRSTNGRAGRSRALEAPRIHRRAKRSRRGAIAGVAIRHGEGAERPDRRTSRSCMSGPRAPIVSRTVAGRSGSCIASAGSPSVRSRMPMRPERMPRRGAGTPRRPRRSASAIRRAARRGPRPAPPSPRRPRTSRPGPRRSPDDHGRRGRRDLEPRVARHAAFRSPARRTFPSAPSARDGSQRSVPWLQARSPAWCRTVAGMEAACPAAMTAAPVEGGLPDRRADGIGRLGWEEAAPSGGDLGQAPSVAGPEGGVVHRPEPPRVSRRPRLLEGWGLWEPGHRGRRTRPSCARARCGWWGNTRASTRRDPRRCG
jgi:hypothetical protein